MKKLLVLMAMTTFAFAGEYERREQVAQSRIPAPQEAPYMNRWQTVILTKILHMPNADITYRNGSVGLDSGEWSVNGGTIICKITHAFTSILGCLDANGKWVGQPILGTQLKKLGL